MDRMELMEFREALRQRVNPLMELSELKEFTDYVLQREKVLDDYIQMFYNDMYQNFREDGGYNEQA